MLYDLVIIGSGAAGLSAGIYAGRYRVRALVIGKEFGGETAKAGAVENYPGFQSVDGDELMDLMKQQAAKRSKSRGGIRKKDISHRTR